jgi:hypothetical protein
MTIGKLGPASNGAPTSPMDPGSTGPATTATATGKTTNPKPHTALSEPPPQLTGTATMAPRRRASFDSLRSLQANSAQAEAANEVRGRITSGALKLSRSYSLPVIKSTTSTAADGWAALTSLARVLEPRNTS